MSDKWNEWYNNLTINDCGSFRYGQTITYELGYNFLHLCTFKTPIIDTFSLDFCEFYSLEYIFLSYYKHLPICSYNILSV